MDGVDGLHTVSQQDVAVRAYYLALARGFEPGHELDDWLQAEAELRAERSPAQASAADGVAAPVLPLLLPEPVQPRPNALAALDQATRLVEDLFAAEAPTFHGPGLQAGRPPDRHGALVESPVVPAPGADAEGQVDAGRHGRAKAAPGGGAGVRGLGGEPVLRVYGIAVLLLALSVFQPGLGTYARLVRTVRTLLALLLLAQVASLALSRRPRRRRPDSFPAGSDRRDRPGG